MQIPFQTLAQDSVLHLRDAMRRVARLHPPMSEQVRVPRSPGAVAELPRPDAVVWADTEIDVRRVLP